jgi:hypothetical protein
MSVFKSKPKTFRINLSVPPEFYKELTYVSKRLGVSSSSLIYNISHDAVGHMSSVLHQVPESGGSDAIIKRLRGESINYIEQQYSDLMSSVEEDRS